MNKMQGKIKLGFDRWFLITSIILVIVIIIVASSLIVFLSNNLLKAFIPKENSESDLKFDLEGYQQVLKDLDRTPITTGSE